MTDRKDQIIESIRAGINYFIVTSFMPNVYNYLFESDIQSHLFMILRESMIPYAAEKPIKIKNHACKEKGYSDLDFFRLNYVYTEYSSNRIDIVCLDPEKTLNYEEYCNKWGDPKLRRGPDPLWDQPPLVGIEIKYIRCGYRKDLSECEADKEKLEEYREKLKHITDRFKYLVLGFVQEHSSGIFECHKTDLVKTTDGIRELDSIYLINRDGVYKYLK